MQRRSAFRRQLTTRHHLLFVLIAALAIAAVNVPVPSAAHSTNDSVSLYPPFSDGDADHHDVSSWWAHNWDTSPWGHRCVYIQWGFAADGCLDVFARTAGRQVVTPYGSRTNTGHAVTSTVVAIAPACASGVIADGGWRVTIEAKDTVTGAILSRVVIAHIANPQVYVGQRLGGWTVIGWTSRFRTTSCYQVTSDWGVHLHVEATDRHGFVCFVRMAYQQPLTELTRIAISGAHYGARRAACS